MASCKNKTLPAGRERNEVSCEQSRGVVAVPVVVEPVEVEVPAVAVEVEVGDVEVAVGIALKYATCLL